MPTRTLQAVEENGGQGEWEMVCHVMDVQGASPPSMAQSKAMKVEGQLEGCPISFLTDSGANHNFIMEELLFSLVLSITNTEEFEVNLGNCLLGYQWFVDHGWHQ